MDDLALLREYAARQSEPAFAELVSRRVAFVYAAALRQVRDAALAEEITQAVFIILARKASELAGNTILTGWLFKTTRFTALAQLRAAARRRQREQEVQMETELQRTTPDPLWEQLSPLLDEALTQLGEKDRQAVLLHFLEGKTFGEVGLVLRTSEEAARKRVSRALEKLRRHFSRSGVRSTTALLAGSISAHSVPTAPPGLALSVAAVAMAKGGTTGGSTLVLVKGALKFMAWKKAKTTILIGAAALLAAGTATLVVRHVGRQPAFEWQVDDPIRMIEVLRRAPPVVRLVPTKFPDTEMGHMYTAPLTDDTKVMGLSESLAEVLQIAYGMESSYRIIFENAMPPTRYDYISTLPSGARAALRQSIQRELKLDCKTEIRNVPVLALKVSRATAPGLRESTEQRLTAVPAEPDHRSWRYAEISELIRYLEDNERMPVVDRTGLSGHYDIDLHWKPKPNGPWYPEREELKRLLVDQLGLELVPETDSIEVLVVKKAK